MEFDLVTNSAVVMGLTLLSLVFIYQTQRKHRRVFYLSFGLILALLAQIFYILVYVNFSNPTDLLLGKFIRDFLFGIFYFFIFIHFHNLLREDQNNYFVNLNFGILSIFASLVLFSLTTRNDLVLELTGRIANLIGLFCFAYVSYVSFLIARMLKERQANIEFFSMFIVFLAHIIYVLGDNFFLSFIDYVTIADTMGIIGVFVLFINYLSNLDYLYRLPFPIHQIIAYNSSGLSIYSRSVYTKGLKTIEIEEMLFSGLISAISNAIKETLGTTTELRYIDATNKHILLQMYKGLTIVIVADNKSKLLMESIKTVNSLVSDELRSKLEKDLVNLNEITNTFDSIIKTAFPYIIFQ